MDPWEAWRGQYRTTQTARIFHVLWHNSSVKQGRCECVKKPYFLFRSDSSVFAYSFHNIHISRQCLSRVHWVSEAIDFVLCSLLIVIVVQIEVSWWKLILMISSTIEHMRRLVEEIPCITTWTLMIQSLSRFLVPCLVAVLRRHCLLIDTIFHPRLRRISWSSVCPEYYTKKS